MRTSRREPLPHNAANGVTVGIWREWSRGSTAIVKRLAPRSNVPPHWLPSEEPTHWNFWRREALAYRSGLPERLGLESPELLDLVNDERGGAELKLEDVAGRTGPELTLDDVGAAAYALGLSQGAPQPRATDAWLSRGFLRAYTTSKPFDRALLDDDGLWAQPLAADHLGHLRDGLTRLRDRRHHYLDVVEGLPRAVCHLDVWMHNIVCRPDGSPVFLDWAFAGVGALGEDPSNLVIDSVMDLLWPPDRLDDLDGVVFAAYCRGLDDAGWAGDVRTVRLAMCAAAVKYEWLPCVMLLQAGEDDHSAYGRSAPGDRLYASRAAGLDLVVRYAAEADTLAALLGR